MLFALAFFSTRIALHIALCVTSALQYASATRGSHAPAAILACVFPLHAFWLYGCIRGFAKRARARKTVSAVVPRVVQLQIIPVVAPAPPAPPVLKALRDRAPLYASRMWVQRRRSTLRRALNGWRWSRSLAVGHIGDMRRHIHASLPARERVYAFVGLERRRSASESSHDSLQ